MSIEKEIEQEIKDKILGVIGLGKIGTEVAKRAKAFGMNILAYDPFVTKETAWLFELSELYFSKLLQAPIKKVLPFGMAANCISTGLFPPTLSTLSITIGPSI